MVTIDKSIIVYLKKGRWEATHSCLGSLPQDFGVQVFHPGLGHSGKEALTDQQSDLSHLGRHQSHDKQGEQDGSQRNDGIIEQQLGSGETLFLKQGHGVGEVTLAFAGLKCNSNICDYLRGQKSKQ